MVAAGLLVRWFPSVWLASSMWQSAVTVDLRLSGLGLERIQRRLMFGDVRWCWSHGPIEKTACECDWVGDADFGTKLLRNF